MSFLRTLEALRTPALDVFFSIITYLGEQTCFMVLAVFLFWCVNKRQAYYLFSVAFFGTTASQFLKLWYRIPRPWVVDPGFTIVEAARAAAIGYSFPSGHTQNIVGTLGVIALENKKRPLRILCAALLVLVPFSRMYLGVHTPLDVGVAFALALVLLALLYPCFRTDERTARAMPWILALLVATAAAYLLFVLRYSFPADIDPENLSSGIKNGYTMAGAMLALVVAYLFDRRYLHFETRAPLAGQILKLVLGLALMMGLRVGLKPVLQSLLPDGAADLVRYFLIVVFGGCLWPMTFPFFQRIGAHKS